MIVPAIGGLGAGGLSLGATEGALQGGRANGTEGLAQAARQGAGSEASGGVEGAQGGFGSSLSEAISALEGTQRSGDAAAQSLATGTVKDPESAVVTVEDASLAMQLASQIRTKATEAAQSIFQTQV